LALSRTTRAGAGEVDGGLRAPPRPEAEHVRGDLARNVGHRRNVGPAAGPSQCPRTRRHGDICEDMSGKVNVAEPCLLDRSTRPVPWTDRQSLAILLLRPAEQKENIAREEVNDVSKKCSQTSSVLAFGVYLRWSAGRDDDAPHTRHPVCRLIRYPLPNWHRTGIAANLQIA